MEWPGGKKDGSKRREYVKRNNKYDLLRYKIEKSLAHVYSLFCVKTRVFSFYEDPDRVSTLKTPTKPSPQIPP